MARGSIKRLIILSTLVAFVLTSLPVSYAQSITLPAPGSMVPLSASFAPPILKGIRVYPDNPFRFDFILDKGDSKQADSELKDESNKLIKYFLASLTIPEQDLWVNLSPYEKDRIVPEAFGQTEMGRDLLAQDYLLKQITASVIYPEGETGKKFWAEVYRQAFEKYGTTDVPVDTFNKVWITPDKAVVYENKDLAFVVESHLKVMLEGDYLATEKSNFMSHMSYEKEGETPEMVPYDARRMTNDQSRPLTTNETQELSKQILREIVIPILEKEVNEGTNFEKLRQVYQSLILAAWYKRKIKGSILKQVYLNQQKVSGLVIEDPAETQKIYEQYLEAFKKGVYSYIKEEINPLTRETVPRKYFSGGIVAAALFDADGVMAVTHTVSSGWLAKLRLTRLISIGTLLLALPSTGILKAADVTGAVSTNRTSAVSEQEEGLFTWQVKGVGGEDTGHMVVMRGIRHGMSEQGQFVLQEVVRVPDDQRQGVAERILKMKINALALQGHQKIVDDLRRLIKSGLGAVVYEGFSTSYTREEMEADKQAFLELKKVFRSSLSDGIIDQVCLLVWGPLDYLYIKGELPENVAYVNAEDKSLAAEWRARANKVFAMKRELEYKILDYKKQKQFSALLYSETEGRYLRINDQEMEALIGQFRDKEAQKWARKVVVLSKEMSDLYDARNAEMMRRAEEATRQIGKGQVVYLGVGREHSEGIRDSMSSGQAVRTPQIEDSGVMYEVQESAIRAVISAVLKKFTGTFQGWETKKLKDGFLFSGAKGAVTFSYPASGETFSIQIVGEGLLDPVKSATDDAGYDVLLIEKEPHGPGGRLVVQIPENNFIQAAENAIEKKLNADGIRTVHGPASGDKAMQTPDNLGGIDFNPDRIDLQVGSHGDELQLNFNPARLQQLRDSSGFEPVIINFQPLADPEIFLGFQEKGKLPSPA